MYLSSGIHVATTLTNSNTSTPFTKKRKPSFRPSNTSSLDLRRTLSTPSSSIQKSSSSSSIHHHHHSKKLDLRSSLSSSNRFKSNSSSSLPLTSSSSHPVQVAIRNDLIKVVTTLDPSGKRTSTLVPIHSKKNLRRNSVSSVSKPTFTVSSSNSSLFAFPKSSNSSQRSSNLAHSKSRDTSKLPKPSSSTSSSSSSIATRLSVAKVESNPPQDGAMEIDKPVSFLSGSPTSAVASHKTFNPYPPSDHLGKSIYTLAVYNLHRAVTVDDLRKSFSKFGGLADVIILGTPSGMSLGQAHISYYDKSHCQAAIDAFNNKLIDGLYLKLEHVKRPSGLQYSLTEMALKNQQDAVAKGFSFLGGGMPYPPRTIFTSTPPPLFGAMSWTG